MGNKEMVSFLQELTKKLEEGKIQVNFLFSNALQTKKGRKLATGKAVTKKILRRRGRKKLNLPTDRQIYLFLHDKQNGESLAAICSQFKVRREHMLPKLRRLAVRETIAEMKGKFYLLRQVRKVNADAATPKAPAKPVLAPEKILDCLKKQKTGTLQDLAKKLGASSFQKLIKPMNSLIKSKKIKCVDKVYSLA